MTNEKAIKICDEIIELLSQKNCTVEEATAILEETKNAIVKTTTVQEKTCKEVFNSCLFDL